MKRIFCSTFFILLFSMALNQVAFGEEKVSSGVPIQGKIESGDKHTYEFETNKDGGVYILLDHITGGFIMDLYDANGKSISQSWASNRGEYLRISENVAKGHYYVRITPYSWSGITDATYRLKATYPGSIKRNTKTFEPNDTNETSMSINSGKFYTSDSFSYADRDIYQFKTNKDGELYITLDHITGGFIMDLYDANGKSISQSWADDRGEYLRISENVAKGTYYVRITPYSWSGITNATYRLKATYAGSIKRDTKTFEPNDTNETAMPIISNKLYSSSSFSYADRDSYKFTTSKDGEVFINVDKITGGFIMDLYDANGKSISQSWADDRGEYLRINEYLSKGTYYVRMTPYSWSGISKASYKLKAIYKDKTPSVNAISNKSTVITGKAYTHTTVYAKVGSKQIGKATAKKGKFSMKIKKQKAGTTIFVYTIDKAGNRSTSKQVKVSKKK